jgi:tetratricopeptide (TPR) repeat protein
MKQSHQNISEEIGGPKPPRLGKRLIRSSAIKTGLIALLFLAIGIFIYSNTFESPFVLDDDPQIAQNQNIRLEELTFKSLLKAASDRKSVQARPVGYISFALNYYFHQYGLFGYHLVNIIIHVLNASLLYLFLKITLSLKQARFKIEHAEWIALFTALLWMVNPVQTQSVTYIVQRLNSMAAMFFLLSFLFYLNGRLTTKKGLQWTWFLGAGLSWLLALGSKQNTAMLPFFIFLYEWYFFQNLSTGWLKRNLRYFFIVFAVFVLVSLIYLGPSPLEKLASIGDYAKQEFTLPQRIMTEWRVVIYYLSLIILPHPSRLNLDYDFPLSYSLFNPMTTVLSLIGIIGLIVLGGFLARKQRLLSFCIFWFLGNLVIESSVIPLAIIFEHRIYLPSMLVCLIPVVLLYRYIQPKWLVAFISCTLIILYAYWTFERNNVWRDGLTLWADCVLKSPNKARPYTNLGVAQKKLNLMDDAFQNFRKAVALNPNYADAHYNLGVILAERNIINGAIEHYRKVVELKPSHKSSRNNLGVALLKKDRTDEAIEQFRLALRIEPRYESAHFNLGVALAKQGRLDEAIEHYVYVIKVNPDDPNAHVKLGDALLMQGKPEQADNHFRKALHLDPDNAEAHLFLGSQLLNQGQRDKALKHLNRAISINPDLPQAHNNVGIIRIREGNLAAAISHFQKAIQLDPGFELANINLKKALTIRTNMEQDAAPIQKSLKDNQNDPVWHFNMGNSYLGERKLRQAIAEFEKSVALRPEFLEARNNLAMAYVADRQYDQALTAFKKLVELDPDHAGAYYNIAVLYALQNNVSDSIAWLKLAIDKGYQNWELIKTDKDLANIRHSQDYKQLVEGH